MMGHSPELQEYYEELALVSNQIIDEQAEFIDYNKTIIATLLGDWGLQLARAFDSNIYKCSPGGDPLIRKLHALHNECAKRLTYIFLYPQQEIVHYILPNKYQVLSVI